MDGKINPWRESRGNRDAVSGGVEPADLSHIFGGKPEIGIPYLPQLAFECEVVAVPAKPVAVIGVAPKDKIKLLIADVLHEFYPHLSVRAVLGVKVGGRGLKGLAMARRLCIRKVKAAYPHFSTPHLGRIFNRDHSTIVYALSDEMITRRARQHQERKARARA